MYAVDIPQVLLKNKQARKFSLSGWEQNFRLPISWYWKLIFLFVILYYAVFKYIFVLKYEELFNLKFRSSHGDIDPGIFRYICYAV
jgi:hypothetical protein